MYRFPVLILAFLFTLSASAQFKTDKMLADLLSANTDPNFREIISQPDKYRVQIIYTEINRDKQNVPHFTNHYFHYDPDYYFNPASMVKMPLAFLSLEKLNQLNKKGVDKFTTIVFDSSRPWQHPLHTDTTARSGNPSIAHFIKRAFLISENDPYNRMYQFVGQGPTNQLLHQKGYNDVRITRQFLGLSAEQNRYTNLIRFLNEKGETIYSQPEAHNIIPFHFPQTIKLGKAHMNSRDSIVQEPFDFTEHNNLSLGTMQQILQSVLFPASVPLQQRFQLTSTDYHFLYQYLSQFPSETPDPKYDTSVFYDSYAKFFFRNSNGNMPEGVRVFNKVGWSYGFLTDVSYVADFKNKVEYMLAATVYVNANETLNDNTYEYKTMGWPFLYQLGQTIYQHELKRKRAIKPDLSRFQIDYEHRDPNDTRPSLRDVDN